MKKKIVLYQTSLIMQPPQVILLLTTNTRKLLVNPARVLVCHVLCPNVGVNDMAHVCPNFIIISHHYFYYYRLLLLLLLLLLLVLLHLFILSQTVSKNDSHQNALACARLQRASISKTRNLTQSSIDLSKSKGIGEFGMCSSLSRYSRRTGKRTNMKFVSFCKGDDWHSESSSRAKLKS